MPSKDELKQLPLDLLAVQCKRIADRPEQCTAAVSDEKLRRQWLYLEGLASSNAAEQEQRVIVVLIKEGPRDPQLLRCVPGLSSTAEIVLHVQ